jgi:hypothetical protein
MGSFDRPHGSTSQASLARGKAADGPGNFALLKALASPESGSEDEFVRATAQIGRLEEIFMAIDAAQTLERLAPKAADDAA